MLRAYGVSDKGPNRPTNEDRFAIHEDLDLCVIADGMGGHNAGEVAARIAVDAVVDFCRGPGGDLSRESHPFGADPALSEHANRLRTAILLANLQILETALTASHFAGMGTTIVAARVVDERLAVGHVGDSRLYLFTRDRLRRLTEDDSWMATMLAHDPEADRLLLQHHPMCGALTNVVGARPSTDVHVVEETLSGGELLLLTTDGVHSVLDDRRLQALVTAGPAGEAAEDPRQIAQNIVATALACGSQDNCTAVVVRWPVPTEAGRLQPTNL